MKTRTMYVFLLLLALFATSLAAQAPVSPSPASDPAFCLQDALSLSTSQPVPQVGGPLFPHPKCGACSAVACGLNDWGKTCGTGPTGQFLICVDSGVCPADGLLQCTCSRPS